MHPKSFNRALGYYVNLSYHRDVILEGIRLVAYRNMGHFNRAREKCGTSSINRQENIASVRDQMIADQGLEADTTNRRFFDFITWYPWDAYLCLLYAEIEYYKWYSKRFPELTCAPLNAFLKQHPRAVRYLKEYRDKVLHPGKDIDLDASLGKFFDALDLDHISFYGIVVNIQHLIDVHADEFRRALYSSAIAEGYRMTAGGPNDRTYLAAYKTGKTVKLETALEMLSKPLTKAADRPELEGRQTPMQPQSLFSLRVRPETLCRITEFSEHESNGRELDEGERVAVEVLPVLGQSAAAVEPGDGAFDHPTPGLDDEALHPIGSLDDLGLEIGQDAGQGAVKDRALIGAVGEQFPEKGKQTEQGRQQRETAVAILNVGGGDDAVQQQALRIDQNMPLLALDQLAGIEAVAVDASPPFSALFTL